MSEGKPGFDRVEGLDEATKEAPVELESAPKLSLSNDEMQRVGRRMDDEAFAKLASRRGFDFSKPVALVLDGVEVSQQFASAKEMRAYIEDNVRKLQN